MDRRRARAGPVVVVAVLVAGCGLVPASAAPSAGRPASESPFSTGPSSSVSAAPASASPSAGWTPGATVTLGSVSSAPLGDFVATRLTATPSGFALIGQDGDQAPLFASGSPHGSQWSRLEAGSLGSALNDLASGLRGSVLATRDVTGDTGHLWFSSDGLTWGRIDQPTGLANVDVVALSAGGAGFALVGDDSSGGSSTPTVWTSSNGHDWQEAQALRGTGIGSILVLDDAFVALVPPGGGDAEVSADGTTWQPVPTADLGPVGTDEELVASGGSRLIVVREAGAGGAIEAWAGTVDPRAGTIDWIRAADAGFTDADFVALVGSQSTAALLGYDRRTVSPAVWTTPDGVGWTRHDLASGALGGGASALLATSGATIASLGWASDADGRSIRQMWRSDDGQSWFPVPSSLFGALSPLSKGQCPATRPTTVAGLLGLAPGLWPYCFGDTPITVTGYVVDCGGCGGATALVGAPSWLIDPLGFSAFWLSPSANGNIGTGMGVDVDPGHPIKIPAFGRRVRLTGHFADPASTTCRLVPSEGTGAELPPPAQALLRCREEFVATGVTVLGG